MCVCGEDNECFCCCGSLLLAIFCCIVNLLICLIKYFFIYIFFKFDLLNARKRVHTIEERARRL